MNELQTMLERVFNLVSAISVQGDYVEIMAETKAILRKAFAKAGEIDEITTECSQEKETENG